MKSTVRTLTPIEQAAEAAAPNQVNYKITVVWPDGKPSTYFGHNLGLDKAAECLEVLAEELRGASS